MNVLLIDGVRYKPWTPKDEEKEFHPIVKEHSTEIFGEKSLYFDIKHKLKSKSGIAAIPDAYALTLSKPYEWYIIENELASHPVYTHIVPQVSKFVDGIENLVSQREIRDALLDEIEQDRLLRAHFEKNIGSELYRFLSELLSKPPKIVIVIDEITPEVNQAKKSLKKLADTEIIELKTFVREGAETVHAHLFEPLYKPEIREPKVERVLKEPPIISKDELASLKEGKVVICPSKPDGIKFLLHYNAWGFVRIRRKPEYLALYISHPESRISFFGEVKEILSPSDARSPITEEEALCYETFKEGKKVIVLKPDSLKKLDQGIPKGTSKKKILQGIKFVSLSSLINAKKLDDL